jgi:hypothetical protein
MNKKEICDLAGWLKGLNVMQYSCELRMKVLRNMIACDGVVNELENAKKLIREGWTEEEKKAIEVNQKTLIAAMNDRSYKLTDEEREANKVVENLNTLFREAMKPKEEEVADVKLEKMTDEEICKLADGNDIKGGVLLELTKWLQ